MQRTASLTRALCLIPLLASCASSGGSGGGSTTDTAGAITLRDYTENSAMGLVSESFLIERGIEGDNFEERRLQFYSAEQTDASAKICHDDAIAGLVEAFEKSGLAVEAIDGPAPASAADRDASIEIQVDGRTQHVMKSNTQDLRAYIEFMQGFVQVYNLYEGRTNVGGYTEFKKPKRNPRYKGDR